jgi:hypothetical protein
VEQLRAWLRRGPAQARVDEVREMAPDDAAAPMDGFHIY